MIHCVFLEGYLHFHYVFLGQTYCLSSLQITFFLPLPQLCCTAAPLQLPLDKELSAALEDAQFSDPENPLMVLVGEVSWATGFGWLVDGWFMWLVYVVGLCGWFWLVGFVWLALFGWFWLVGWLRFWLVMVGAFVYFLLSNLF